MVAEEDLPLDWNYHHQYPRRRHRRRRFFNLNVFTFENITSDRRFARSMAAVHASPNICCGLILLIVFVCHLDSIAKLKTDYRPLWTYAVIDFCFYAWTCLSCSSCIFIIGARCWRCCFVLSVFMNLVQFSFSIWGACQLYGSGYHKVLSKKYDTY